MRRPCPSLLFAFLALPCLSSCQEAETGPEMRVVDRVSGALVAEARIRTLTGGAYVEVTAPGYLTMRVPAQVAEVRLFPEVTSQADDEKLSERFAAQRDARLRIEEGDLTPQARAIEERIDARSAVGASTSLADIDARLPPRARARDSAATVPETIRVWRRSLDDSTASCSGRVDVIPFDTYVKGVLPHEWIPSWEGKALEMGAVAVRTYAAAWVAAGGKYDCADLDDTTASQVYRDETLPRTDAAVDSTASVLVLKDGALVFTEYSAENSDPTADAVREPYCTGRARNGHGRGTCQWGTQRWALNEDRNFEWMSAHYYPGAIAERLGGDADDADEDSGGCRMVGTTAGHGGPGGAWTDLMPTAAAMLLLVIAAWRNRRAGSRRFRLSDEPHPDI